ncbi:MAG: hypothetical protein ACREAW_06750 [Nitrososphaera sp.]
MPATKKVSVAWQVVFTFLPIVNFWAFYRIKKLQKYLLYVIVPSIAVTIVLVAYIFSVSGVWVERPGNGVPALSSESEDTNVLQRPEIWGSSLSISIISNVIGFGFQGLAIYLVIIWSRKYNQQFDQPPEQAGQSQ